MEPLHTHFEYEMACRIARILKNKSYMVGLSENDAKEQKELKARIFKYRKDSLKPKIEKI